MFSSANTSLSRGVRKRPRRKSSSKNLENGEAVGGKSDLGNFHEVFHGETKQRVYDEQRELVGNYKTVLCKEEPLQKVIEKDSEEGLVSGDSPESEFRE